MTDSGFTGVHSEGTSWSITAALFACIIHGDSAILQHLPAVPQAAVEQPINFPPGQSLPLDQLLAGVFKDMSALNRNNPDSGVC